MKPMNKEAMTDSVVRQDAPPNSEPRQGAPRPRQGMEEEEYRTVQSAGARLGLD
jgi:hypothetical protein